MILGNGITGVCAAETIRQFDSKGGITMVADETFTPYSRPMISMVLAGQVASDKLPIRSSSFYEDLKITPLLGKPVSEIDVDQKQVMTQNGKSLHCDRLLIATGADPRPIKAEGLNLKNIFFMRTEAHVRKLLAIIPRTKEASRILIGHIEKKRKALGLDSREA